ncbi:hypothetical protein F53441_2651 [Fusarium austroafricanum]|uniref:Mid2 domain-containing protein n=1 Tax=Fusarium austroafricanum TaxID=2364996 RepID=A0A8H4KPH0_9HYPO|nr:hypothetical protein F53441_2651 [Fusarium austroafricanum]
MAMASPERGPICSSFSCQTEKGWPWYSTDLCTIVIPTTVEVIYAISTVGGDWETSTTNGARANAIGIPIRWHSSDFSIKTPGASTAETAGATETSSSSGGGGRSTGAKAGIGVGIGVAALAGFAALIWFVLRARRTKQANTATEEEWAQEPQKVTVTMGT